jgi:predicted ribonuclease toxin of YeeF-YezG toxin-antitoxin module
MPCNECNEGGSPVNYFPEGVKFSEIAGPLVVVVASFFYEPIDYASTAVQCVTAGCSPVDVLLTLAPGSLSAMNKLADVFRAGEKAGDAVKAVENAGDAIHAAKNTGDVANAAIDAASTYKRPSGYRKGVRDEVWENAKGPDGSVRDSLTGQVMSKDEAWDMGHKPGYEFRKHQQSAAERGISRKQFLDEYNNPAHYRPELPPSNRGHRGEDFTDSYFGP